MHRRQHQVAQILPAEPERQLAAQDAAFLARPHAGDDLDAAQPVPLGAQQEAVQSDECRLCGASMQVEPALGAQPAVREMPPAGIVEPRLAPSDLHHLRRGREAGAGA